MYNHIKTNITEHLSIRALGKIAGFIALVLSIGITSSASAQNSLDPTFNGGVTDSIGGNYVSAVQPDGKILVGGDYRFVNGAQRGYLARLNADGTIDNSFNPGGSGPNASVLEIVILADGRILIGGSFGSYNGTGRIGIARLNSDGTLDTTFDPGSGINGGRLTSIVVQPDGKILAAGQGVNGYNGNANFGISRLNSNGSFDSSFVSGFTTSPSIEQIDLQADGKVIIGGFFSSYGGSPVSGFIRVNSDGSRDTSFSPVLNGAVGGLKIQANGKILIGGDFSTYNGVNRVALARANADGSLDTSFVPPTFAGSVSYVEFFAVQTDGKILAAGSFDLGTNNILPLIRMNADGSLDNSFSSRADSGGYHVTIQADQKVILTGFFSRFSNGAIRNGIARFNPDGTIDSSFNTAFTDYGIVNAITQQADGKVLVGGSFQKANGSLSNGIARFNADGTLDGSFTIGSGTAGNLINSSFNAVNVITVQTDGKILVGGSFGSFNGSTPTPLVRLNSNGTLDTSFNLSGNLNLTLIPSVESILVQPDGKIIIGGRFFANTGASSRLYRLNSDGSIDTTFNAGAVTSNNVVYRILRQTDGKLIIVGAFTTYGGISRTRIARINADGTLDTTFTPGTGASAVIYDAILQADGKVIIAGDFTTYNGTPRNRIARVNADGSLDTSFDPGTGADGTVFSINALPTGKILIGGRFATYNATAQNRLARINADGSLDASFVSGIENNPAFFVRRVAAQFDGKPLIGGTFDAYSGISRNNIARLFTPETTGGTQPILFTSNRDGNNEIYRMNADGTNQQRLTNTPESEFNPVWSPDGTKIVFTRVVNTNVRQVWTMNADGTNQRRLSDEVVFEFNYRYSPNGQKILFERRPAFGVANLWTMNADGTNKVQLTDSTMLDHFAEWSPNGDRVAFGRCNPQFICDVYTVKADGTNLTNLTPNNPDDDDNPKWTSDGNRIVYGRGTANLVDTYIMNADGTNQQRLTNSLANQAQYPQAISPDGNTIAIEFRKDTLNIGPSLEISTVRLNGSSYLQLTDNSVLDLFSAWSPDSAKIAFRSQRDQPISEIYTMNADGTNVVRLTFNTASDVVTDWYRPQAAPRRELFDFDGDGKSDISVFRPSSGTWFINGSTNGFSAVNFGVADDKLAPADYDGDGKTDVAVFRNGIWYILNSSNGAFRAVQFGSAGDIPVPADYDGDQKADIAVFRPSNGFWYRTNSSNDQFIGLEFGIAEDKPVPGDYDGDGKANLAVFRPSAGSWYIARATGTPGQNFDAVRFGLSTDVPVPADYDGDGKTDVTVFRPSNGTWYRLNSSDGAFVGTNFGQNGDIPVAADYDGDGKADIAVFRPSASAWYRLNSSNGTFSGLNFGISTDKPIPASFQ